MPAHPNAFFSFATIISGRSPAFHKLLRAIEPHRLLIESDFSDTSEIDHQVRAEHEFAVRQVVLSVLCGQIWEVFEEIQTALDWTAEKTIETLQTNFRRFMTPIEERPPPKKTSRERRAEQKRRDLYVSDDESDAGF